MKLIKNKYLIAEIWEIQAILYLILAQIVETDWIMWALRIYGVFTMLTAMVLKYLDRKENEKI